ncbi:N-acetylmuramoyl-L-alanine amidase [Zeaxanthinibacter sp. PT1]|uniref:N-acetylmuramoyl-L-alanine amidase n=1 Tax=Zeaxanthinibacter TaxID=561554 RepID=UPI0023495575|nr:N-acetylmuramoyl-L-alanine amidase [Zeaxanthinibacter sp. PT1]MDC6351208.1 N-acetylmuramoyl-L-alanine amidase [Zeaxanthinibacter sp. PT1]
MKINYFFVLVFLAVCSSGTAQDSLLVVTAERGDGVYSLLRKQGMDPARYYDIFLEMNQVNLRDGQELYAGRKYRIPYIPESVTEAETEERLGNGTEYPIFGSKWAYVSPVSEKLKGAVYYLISGHGGPDPGAIEEYNGKTIAEDEYAYDVTLRLARELLSHGANVYIIVRDADDGIRDERTLEIDNDEVVYPNEQIPLNQLERLRQRVDAVNKLYYQNMGSYQRLIVTHVDSRSRGQNIDVFFYHHEKSKNGKRLAESIHDTFYNKYRQYQPNRDYEGTFSDRSSLYLVKNTLPAMAYIEIGNLRNKRDQQRILDPDNRQALAKWISEGAILDYSKR